MSGASSTIRNLYDVHGEKLRYLVVGGWNTLFSVLLFNAMVLLFGRELYLVWFWASWVIAVVQSTAMMKYVVFRRPGHLWRQVGRAYFIYLPAQGLSTVILWAAVQLVHLHVAIGQLIAIGVTTVFSYIGHKYFTFRLPLEVAEVPSRDVADTPGGAPGGAVASRQPAHADPPAVLRALEPTDAQTLGEFFERLAADPGSAYFRPHPLTVAYARELCSAVERKDEYFVAVMGDHVVGYAMLRGWDEGYSVPAFGVAVDKDHRGQGLGRALLEHAVMRARKRGASEVMLKVDPGNADAKHLYESVGFTFAELADDGVQLKGVLALTEPDQ